jgi:hypothetical protein
VPANASAASVRTGIVVAGARGAPSVKAAIGKATSAAAAN